MGSDTGTPVDDRVYQVPFTFTARLQKLTVKVGPGQMLPPQKKKIGERD